MSKLCKKTVSILLAALLVVSLFAAVPMTAGATVYYSYEDILFSSLCEGDYITVGVGTVYDQNNEYTVVLKGGTYAQYDLDNKVYVPCDTDLTIENGSCRILTEASFESVYLYSNSNYYSSYINGAKANAFYVESISGTTITFAGTDYAFANESEYFNGHSITVGGEIGVNFFVDMTPEEAQNATVSLSWMKDGREKTSSVDMSKATLTDNGYVATCQVSASDMTAAITATLTIGNDKVDTDTYTVKEYADYILAHTDVAEYAKAEPLVKAMLNYGAAAQAYFDRNTENLANAGLSTGDQIINSVTAGMINKPYDSTKTNLPDGVEFKKVTLSLMSETTLSLYFESGAKLSFSCEGMTVDPDTVDNYQVARIRNIAAKNLGDDFTLTVTAGEDSGSVTYSPMTYCYNVLDKNADSLDLEIMKLQVAVMTLYWYWQEAAAYFAPDPA